MSLQPNCESKTNWQDVDPDPRMFATWGVASKGYRRWFLKVRSKSALGWKIEGIQLIARDTTITTYYRNVPFPDRATQEAGQAYRGFMDYYLEGKFMEGPDAPDVPER